VPNPDKLSDPQLQNSQPVKWISGRQQGLSGSRYPAPVQTASGEEETQPFRENPQQETAQSPNPGRKHTQQAQKIQCTCLNLAAFRAELQSHLPIRRQYCELSHALQGSSQLNRRNSTITEEYVDFVRYFAKHLNIKV
jgi:hypothetical protein